MDIVHFNDDSRLGVEAVPRRSAPNADSPHLIHAVFNLVLDSGVSGDGAETTQWRAEGRRRIDKNHPTGNRLCIVIVNVLVMSL